MILILLLLTLLCGWILTVLGSGNRDYISIISGLIVGVIIPFITVVVASDNISGEPSAMDVYQGKTTLEITYKNGVPVDSVVIFKDKEK